MSDPIVGIDLGTSNTVVAYADATGAARVLADPAGFKIHPSVVSFHPNGGVVVGAAAKQRKVIDPQNTVYSIKRLIGRSYDSPEVQQAKKRMSFKIEPGDKGAPAIVTRAGKYAVPEVSAIVLDYIKGVATGALGEEVKRAVVTVPASFNDAQRSATATAGSIAGLSVVRVLNEPTAAALAYGHARHLRSIIAVYDFGGGTFDITILKLQDQVYEVLGTAGDTFLGGDDIDERLVDRMVEKFLLENRLDLRQHELAMMRLRAVAEQVKIELSRRSRAVVKIDEIAYGPSGKPLDLHIEIRRDEMVAQVADIIDRTFPVCDEALQYAQLTTDHIDDVILVGGTTKMPYVRDQVTKFFSKAPRTDVSPEDAVALGAGLQAQALDRVLKRKPSRPPSETTLETTATQTNTETTNELTFDDLGTAPPSDGEVLELADKEIDSGAVRSPRATQMYGSTPAIGRAPTHGERPVERGVHHDVFEERTPPPVSPNAAPIGRMAAKPGTQRIPAARPPAPPSKTPTAKGPALSPTVTAPGVMPPPPPHAAPPPVPTSQAKTLIDEPHAFANTPTASQATTLVEQATTLVERQPQTPPAPPPTPPRAPPQAKTIAVQPSPAATAPGMPPPPPAMAQTMIAPPAPPPALPVVLDVTPRSLGIGTVGGFCEELIRRNSRVPTEIRKLFTTSRDQQDAVRIVVVQGESRRLNDNTVIGDLLLADIPPRPRGETSIEVTFALDASGILQVRARDAQTGREQRAALDVVGAMPEGELAASRDRLAQLRR